MTTKTVADDQSHKCIFSFRNWNCA